MEQPFQHLKRWLLVFNKLNRLAFFSSNEFDNVRTDWQILGIYR